MDSGRAGCNIALAADVRIASEAARFGKSLPRGPGARRRWHLFFCRVS